MSSHQPPAAEASAAAPANSTLAPVTISYALGNTYTLLPTHSAPLDHTRRHRKIHDWILYIDILPGSNPDIVDKVTFDMRDDSFRGLSFTCHCPIRIRDSSASDSAASGEGRAEQSNSLAKTSNRQGETTQEMKMPSTNPRPRNSSRWRFSTRQQTYGSVDVRITIRGVGGSKSVIDYHIVLREGAPEVFGSFVERRPNSVMRPIKMMDGEFGVCLCFGLDETDEMTKPRQMDSGAENRTLLQQIAKSIYSRSKRPMTAILHNPCNGESWREDWFVNKSKNKESRSEDNAWTLSFASSSVTKPTLITVSSPNLIGGNGLNECYKIIEGIPSYLTCTYQKNQKETQNYQQKHSSLHVNINVSNLTLLQIIKVCQNYIKYEDSIDSFMPWYRRDDCCCDCRSNKLAMRSDNADERLNNKDRNTMIGKCTSFRDLIACLNPEDDNHYKLNLRNLIAPDASSTNNNISIEFRQHPSSKDKTTTTHWIRFCMAFVKNSARLRAPMALKNSTSIEDEFDLLFEFVVKDRALRNFYRERRDEFAAREEEERLERTAMGISTLEDDSMSISDGESDGEVSDLKVNLKRDAEVTNVVNKKIRQS